MKEITTCPECDDDAIAVLEPGESVRTPGQIDDSWKLCVIDDGVVVHNLHYINDWTAEMIGRKIERHGP